MQVLLFGGFLFLFRIMNMCECVDYVEVRMIVKVYVQEGYPEILC